MELLYLAVGILIGGMIIGSFLFSKKGKQDAKAEILNSELQKTETELNTEREKNTNSQSEISRLDTINLNLQEKLNDQKKEMEELQIKLQLLLKTWQMKFWKKKPKNSLSKIEPIWMNS